MRVQHRGSTCVEFFISHVDIIDESFNSIIIKVHCLIGNIHLAIETFLFIIVCYIIFKEWSKKEKEKLYVYVCPHTYTYVCVHVHAC